MNENDLELAEQLAILGVDLGDGANVKVPEPVQQAVTEPVQQAAIPQPYTPENPTNLGVVTNSVQPVQQIVQEQENNNAAAQVVQPTTSTVAPQSYTVTKSTVENVKPAATPVSSAPAPTDDVVFIDLAKAVRTSKTPWLRLKDNEWTRVVLFNINNTQPIKVHYLKGLGWVQCLSKYTPEGWLENPAVCCKKIGPNGEISDRLDENGNVLKAKSRFLVPVIEYPVDKNNGKTIIPGQRPQLKMWSMNVVEWGDLISRVQAIADNPDELKGVDLNNIDFLLHKDSSKKYGTIDINVMPNSLRASYEADFQTEILKANSEFYSTALKEARKIVSEDVIVRAYASQEAENQMVDNMMNQQGYPGSQSIDI